MKTKYRVLVLAFLSFWLILGLNACGDDNSTGTEDEICNSISLPSQLAPAQIATDYFESQNVPQEEEHSTYHQVEAVAIAGSNSLTFGGSAALITSFLAVAPGLNIQPEAQDGNCVWDINFAEDFPQFGIDASVFVTASPVSDGVNWEVVLDGELSEGETVQDFLFLEGFTSNDESTGEWNGYDPENPDSPAYIYTWDIESENDYELNLDAFEQEVTIASINYVRSGVENDMSYMAEGQTSAEIYWNEETDSGWIDPEEGERMCYTDFVNSACS